jgi:hypothetical protein
MGVPAPALVGASTAEARDLSGRRRSDNILRALQDHSNTMRPRLNSSTTSIKTDTAKATTNMAMGTTRGTADSNTTMAATEEVDLRIKIISRNTTIRARMDREGGADDRCPTEGAAQ